jgi:type II secretory pathway component PulJ
MAIDMTRAQWRNPRWQRTLTKVERRVVARLRQHHKNYTHQDDEWRKGWSVGLLAAINLIKSGWAGRTPLEMRRRKKLAAKWVADALRGVDSSESTFDFSRDEGHVT